MGDDPMALLGLEGALEHYYLLCHLACARLVQQQQQCTGQLYLGQWFAEAAGPGSGARGLEQRMAIAEWTPAATEQHYQPVWRVPLSGESIHL
jgi:hypothetical protein